MVSDLDTEIRLIYVSIIFVRFVVEFSCFLSFFSFFLLNRLCIIRVVFFPQTGIFRYCLPYGISIGFI